MSTGEGSNAHETNCKLSTGQSSGDHEAADTRQSGAPEKQTNRVHITSNLVHLCS